MTDSINASSHTRFIWSADWMSGVSWPGSGSSWGCSSWPRSPRSPGSRTTATTPPTCWPGPCSVSSSPSWPLPGDDDYDDDDDDGDDDCDDQAATIWLEWREREPGARHRWNKETHRPPGLDNWQQVNVLKISSINPSQKFISLFSVTSHHQQSIHPRALDVDTKCPLNVERCGAHISDTLILNM